MYSDNAEKLLYSIIGYLKESEYGKRGIWSGVTGKDNYIVGDISLNLDGKKVVLCKIKIIEADIED